MYLHTHKESHTQYIIGFVIQKYTISSLKIPKYVAFQKEKNLFKRNSYFLMVVNGRGENSDFSTSRHDRPAGAC